MRQRCGNKFLHALANGICRLSLTCMHTASVEALEAVHGVKYAYGNIATTIYPASGSSADWTYGVANVKYSYAVELRDRGTRVAAHRIPRHGSMLLTLRRCVDHRALWFLASARPDRTDRPRNVGRCCRDGKLHCTSGKNRRPATLDEHVNGHPGSSPGGIPFSIP